MTFLTMSETSSIKKNYRNETSFLKLHDVIQRLTSSASLLSLSSPSSSSSISSSSSFWPAETEFEPWPNFSVTWANLRCKFSETETGVFDKISVPFRPVEPDVLLLFAPRDRFRFCLGFEEPEVPPPPPAAGDRCTLAPRPCVVSCLWRWAFCRKVWSQREQLKGRTSSCMRMWTTWKRKAKNVKRRVLAYIRKWTVTDKLSFLEQRFRTI